MRIKFFKITIFLVISLIIASLILSIDLLKLNSVGDLSLSQESYNKNIVVNLTEKKSNIVKKNSLFNYGNWCGITNTKSPDIEPIDEVDRVCKAHDLCIGNNDHKCSCDAKFLRDMPGATAIYSRGEDYKLAVIKIIENKPCYCSTKISVGEIKLLGFGGKCQ